MQIFLPSPQLVIPFRSYSFHFILYSWFERECYVWDQEGLNYLPKWPFCDSVSPSNRFVSPSNHQLQLSSYICYMWQEWAFFHGLYYIAVHLNVFQLNLVIGTMCQNSTDHVPEPNWSKYSNFIIYYSHIHQLNHMRTFSLFWWTQKKHTKNVLYQVCTAFNWWYKATQNWCVEHHFVHYNFIIYFYNF